METIFVALDVYMVFRTQPSDMDVEYSVALQSFIPHSHADSSEY